MYAVVILDVQKETSLKETKPNQFQYAAPSWPFVPRTATWESGANHPREIPTKHELSQALTLELSFLMKRVSDFTYRTPNEYMIRILS